MTGARARPGRLLAPLGVLLVVAVAVTACTGPGAGPRSASPDSVLASSRVKSLLADLPQRSVASPPTMRLAPGLAPPTNRWFSGLVFGDAPNPVFPFPIWFDATPDGFATALPTASSTATSIGTSVENRLTVGLGATQFRVSAYDAVSATLEYRAGTKILGRATIAEGSPVVSYTAARSGTVTLSGSIERAASAGRGIIRVGDQDWAVVTSRARIDGTRVTLSAESTLSLFPVPSGTGADALTSLMDAADSPLTGVSTSYSAVEAGQRTTLDYRTAGRGGTLLVPLPHQGNAARTCTQGSYRTIYGDVPLCVGSQLQFTTPAAPVRASLDLSSVSEVQKEQLRRSLAADVRSLPEYPADTYFGGKALYRSALLLQLARQLGDAGAEKSLTASLVGELGRWMDPKGCRQRESRCFVYDPALKTVVGEKASFGSELANDHQFHYGYFLYAAGVVAQDSPTLARSWAPVMDTLAADIATDRGRGGRAGPGAVLPDRRTFDPYFSHSWASGFSEFASGNNQESSSEAVTAWAGLRLWAKASGDSALASEGAWMQSAEAASALAYWLAPELKGDQFQGFQRDMVSLNWGGKRDFATWFSAEPSAVIGIQLIPMSPSSGYLAGPGSGGSGRIAALSDAALAAGTGSPLSDYALMYRALAGSTAAQDALAQAERMPQSSIDNGNSRTYLLAYIMSAMGRSS